MTQPFSATYADMKIIKTRQVVQIVLEAPLELMPSIVAYLGAPNPANESWVAVARIIETKAENLPVQQRNTAEIGKGSQGIENTLETQKNAKPYGEQAKALILSGFFKHLDVWQEIASEAEYFRWLREQPSCVSGKSPCVVAHIRRASQGAGIGIKPPYFAVPLTDEEHKMQHQGGESVLWDSKEEPEKHAFKYLETYMKDKLKHMLGYDSLASIPPHVLYDWCETRNLTKYLPTSYKL